MSDAFYNRGHSDGRGGYCVSNHYGTTWSNIRRRAAGRDHHFRNVARDGYYHGGTCLLWSLKSSLPSAVCRGPLVVSLGS